MKEKQDKSFGVIPLWKEGDTLKVFLINQIDWRSDDDYWTLPKGHAEPGETPKSTALRELQEETGLEIDGSLSGQTFEQRYEYVRNDILIKKHVTFFVGFVKSLDYSVQVGEVRSGEWLTLDEAHKKLSQAVSREMFTEVIEHLRKSGHPG